MSEHDTGASVGAPLSIEQATANLRGILIGSDFGTIDALIAAVRAASDAQHGKDWTPPNPAKVDDALNLTLCVDAKVWAEQFVARFGGDEGLMLAYFANAIMAGWDEATRRAKAASDAQINDHIREIVRLKGLLDASDAQQRRLLEALKALSVHMDRVGGDRDGMPECPWCKHGPDGDDHAGNCELLAARDAITEAEAYLQERPPHGE